MTARHVRDEFISERRSLGISVIFGLILAASGIAIGVITDSQIILFDGFYTFLGIGLSWMALRVSHLVASGPTDRYPFGREALAPLIIGIEGVALLATCIYATFNAILTIVDGGSKVPSAWAIAYASLALVISTGLYVSLRRSARTSELVRAEGTAWQAGAVLGLAMLLAFIFARIIVTTSWDPAARYVDPSLVIVACLAFVVPPIHMIRSTFIELVEGSPQAELRDEAHAAVDAVGQAFGLSENNLRMTKIGRKFYVELDFVVSPDWTVRQSDQVRQELKRRLSEIPHDLWLVVEFTADPRGA
jgi:predicted Co/Zn/Cd cation transporter (cation efflux family)